VVGGVNLALKARIARYLRASGYTREAAEAEAAKFSRHSGRVGMYTAASEAGIVSEPPADEATLLDRPEQRFARLDADGHLRLTTEAVEIVLLRSKARTEPVMVLVPREHNPRLVAPLERWIAVAGCRHAQALFSNRSGQCILS
jgi:hypothetical protein